MVIIDGKSVFYRGYYAMPNLATKNGIPTGGIYGFTTLSLEIIKKLKPDYVAVAWDKPKTNIRKRLEIYPEYKAGRKPAPPDFYAQIPILHELLEALGWPLYELDDYEADDIMATLAEKARNKDIETDLVTSDLDALQCINGSVKVYIIKKGFSEIDEFHPESFAAKYGIQASQYLDLKSLKGDSSDNIPGVPGIGEKTATQLLKQYKSLDGIYENLDLINNAVHTKLKNGKEKAYLSKKLATLMIDAPVDLDLEAMDVHDFDPIKLHNKLEELEFRSLVRQLNQITNTMSDAPNMAPKGNLYLPKLVSASDYSLNSNPLIVHSFCRDAQGINPYVIVLGNEDSVAVFDLPKDKKRLKQLIQDFGKEGLIGYDTKKDIKALSSVCETDIKIEHDIQVGAFLLDSLRAPKSLAELAESEVGYQLENYQNIAPEDISHFAAEITGVIMAVYKKQKKELDEEPKLKTLASDVEWQIIPILSKMEVAGIGLDQDYLHKMSKDLEDQISDLEQTIYGYADQEFNVASPQQLSKVLFEDLNLPTTGLKKRKTGYSTAANELEKLKGMHPIIECISRFREYSKLKNTYVDVLPRIVGADGRLHTTFNLTATQTGRLSSSEPNLQNIPVRTEIGKRIRTAFTAGTDRVFVSADYSQFELRLAAVMAGDTDMIEVFNNGEDIHTRTAAEVYGIALDDVTKEQRSNAKTINFGVLYGMSPHGLADATHMNFAEAREFIDRYFAARRPLVEYIEGLREQARNQGYVETLFGRRRPTPDVRSSNFIVREAALRQAVNMPIQGTEADLMKMAMIELDKQLPKQSRQLLQIHDSILVESPESISYKVADILKNVMENIYPSIGIKLAVEIKVGKNWGEL